MLDADTEGILEMLQHPISNPDSAATAPALLHSFMVARIKNKHIWFDLIQNYFGRLLVVQTHKIY